MEGSDARMRRRLRVVTEEKLHTDQQEKQTNGKGGGKQGLRFIDGVVPLCIRSREEMIKESVKVKGGSEETNEGSDSKERTRKEANSENKANDTSSSSTREKSRCEMDDENVTFVVLQHVQSTFCTRHIGCDPTNVVRIKAPFIQRRETLF